VPDTARFGGPGTLKNGTFLTRKAGKSWPEPVATIEKRSFSGRFGNCYIMATMWPKNCVIHRMQRDRRPTL
jgi:hypothetical protein